MGRLDRVLGVAGPYALLLRMALIALALLSASRIGLFLWQADRVTAAGNVWHMLVQGVRADLILVGLWLALPVLLAPLMAWRGRERLWFGFCYGWAVLGLVLMLFIELSTPTFIAQYDLRPNRIFIEYLKYPREVFATLWNGFRLPFVGGILLTIVLGVAVARVMRMPADRMRCWSRPVLWLTWPLVAAAVFMAIRSTTSHRPANPAMFAITGDALVNSLIINSGYSVLYAAYSLKNEATSSDIYGKMPQEEVMREVLQQPWLRDYQFVNAEYPTLHWQESTRPRERPLNLVIVIEESLGATFVESLGGLPVTPDLEALKEEGWWFDNLYSTGTRSVNSFARRSNRPTGRIPSFSSWPTTTTAFTATTWCPLRNSTFRR